MTKRKIMTSVLVLSLVSQAAFAGPGLVAAHVEAAPAATAELSPAKVDNLRARRARQAAHKDLKSRLEASHEDAKNKSETHGKAQQDLSDLRQDTERLKAQLAAGDKEIADLERKLDELSGLLRAGIDAAEKARILGEHRKLDREYTKSVDRQEDLETQKLRLERDSNKLAQASLEPEMHAFLAMHQVENLRAELRAERDAIAGLKGEARKELLGLKLERAKELAKQGRRFKALVSKIDWMLTKLFGWTGYSVVAEWIERAKLKEAVSPELAGAKQAEADGTARQNEPERAPLVALADQPGAEHGADGKIDSIAPAEADQVPASVKRGLLERFKRASWRAGNLLTAGRLERRKAEKERTSAAEAEARGLYNSWMHKTSLREVFNAFELPAQFDTKEVEAAYNEFVAKVKASTDADLSSFPKSFNGGTPVDLVQAGIAVDKRLGEGAYVAELYKLHEGKALRLLVAEDASGKLYAFLPGDQRLFVELKDLPGGAEAFMDGAIELNTRRQYSAKSGDWRFMIDQAPGVKSPDLRRLKEFTDGLVSPASAELKATAVDTSARLEAAP